MRKYPGLSKRSNSPYWQINKTVKYRRKKVVIRESTGCENYELALQYCQKREQEELERLIHGLRYPFTVEDAAAKLMSIDGRNNQSDVYHCDMLVAALGHVPLAEMHNDHPDLAAFRQARLKTCKNNTVNRSLEVLRHMLNLAAYEWKDNGMSWIQHPPRIKLLPRRPGRFGDVTKGESGGYPLTHQQQREMFRRLPMHAYLVAWFITMTGCREHEVLPERDAKGELIGGLRWQYEVKLPNGWSVFDLPMSKNGRPRRIFLNSVAREIVETVRGDHPEFVFVFRGRTDKGGIAKPFTKLNNTAWKRARQEVGLEHCRGENMHLRVHDLRHTFATRLREAGVSREDRKDLLGHVNHDITTHYSAAETMTMVGMVERLVESAEKPALYLVHNTHSTQSENRDVTGAASA
ncbi:tyrosine-type recombinase/integrase [Thiohalobacter thiocyanaticus]|uniref:tyrosine-type recombinase/integrase n=1 Tax=Thiohalobacter thiocyanaticus TaxID=585455 RepID=UPI000BBA947F|nr:tyrosine-type recombinase/integrase [Thiohalobacter thiocyanaticus]